MAPQVSNIFIDLGIRGYEGLDKLKSAFRDLHKTVGPTSQSLDSAIEGVKKYAEAATQSEQLIRGQIEAFKGIRSQLELGSKSYIEVSGYIANLQEKLHGSTAAIDRQREALLKAGDAAKQSANNFQKQISALEQLRAQTRPGSSAFLQISKDIDKARESLGRFKSEASAAANALTQMPGTSLDVLGKQISKIQTHMQSLKIASDEFLASQQRIALLSTVRSVTTGRQQVRAAAQMYESQPYQGFVRGRSAGLELPDTTAALNLELSELSDRLANTSRSSTEYVNIAMRMADVQKQLRAGVMGTSEAFDKLNASQRASERRAGKIQGIAEYYGGIGSRDPYTGAIIAGGTPTTRSGRVRPGTQYAQPIGPQPYPQEARTAEAQLTQAYEDMTRIQKRALAERVELQVKNNQLVIDKLLEGADLEAQLKKKQFEVDLADFDRRLDILDKRRQRRRITPGQAVQTAGAVISGGIFGGAEGFLGGLGGAALGLAIPGLGAVGGAFAGSAAGAQVGILRQQLGGTAEYAASIEKLQIALRGVAGSQAAYQQAIAAAAAATRDLNIPQEEATRGLTRLSAAVIGAGGTIGDASMAFRAMSSAIKATGGGAEQVDGALLALTQVFSKGKVSAEELNQIAERLPGTFTLFAKATGRTGPELTKALEQGKVSLNDLMKFLDAAQGRYGQTALKMAASSQEAGARMTVAFQTAQLEIGKALQPLGAELQSTFAVFIKDATPGIANAAKTIGSSFKGISEQTKTIEVIAKLALEFGTATLAVKAFTAMAGPLQAALLAIQGAMMGATQQTTIATARLATFATAAKAAAASLIAPIVLTVAIVGADIVINALRDIEAAQGRISKLKQTQSAPEWLKSVGGSALTREQLTKLANQMGKDYAQAQDELNTLLKQREQAKATYPGGPEAFDKFMKETSQGAYQGDPLKFGSNRLAALLEEATRRVKVLSARYQILIDTIPGARGGASARPGFQEPAGTGAGTTAADAAANRQQQLLEEQLKQRLRVEDTVFQHQIELDRKRYELQKELLDLQTQNRIEAETGIKRDIMSSFEQLRSRLRAIDERQAEANRAVTSAERTLSSAISQATGVYRQGNIGPTSTGPHFDIKRSDRSYFERNALDEYVRVNGRPLSQGVTVGGGQFNSPRSGRIHGGWDYAFGSGAQLSLTGGAKWVSNRPGTANGDETAFMTPDGKVYKILHGTFQPSAVSGGVTAAQAAQQRRGLRTAGTAGVEAADLQSAQAAAAELALAAPQLKAEEIKAFILGQTKALREQNAELTKSNDLEAYRNTLIEKGYGSSQIDNLMKIKELEQRRTETAATFSKLIAKHPADAEYLNRALTEQNGLYTEQIRLLERAASLKADQSPARRIGERRGQVREELDALTNAGNITVGVAAAVGTAFSDSFKNVVSGAATAQEALAGFFQSVANHFLDMAAQIIAKWIEMAILNTVLSLFPGGGGGFAGGGKASDFGVMPGMSFFDNLSAKGNVFAANGIVPYAMGGIVTRPTLFPFAAGGTVGTGLMGEAGPEAIMPLRRGPDGRLGVSAGGGGAVNVVVNVDASGSKVQGDAGQGAALGRAVSQAVQAELVKQKRPGGLLAS